MAKLQDYYRARDLIEELLRQELIGPISTAEILRERPDTTYSLGILWPKKSSLAFDELSQMSLFETEPSKLGGESLEGADLPVTELEDDLEEFAGKIVTANLYKPSGLALTVLVPADVEQIQVRFTGARYFSQLTQDTYERKLEGGETESVTRDVRIYQRKAFDTGSISMAVANGRVRPESFDCVEIALFIRHVFGDHSKLVTVCVTNQSVLDSNNFVSTAENAIFQSELSLSVTKEFLHLGDRGQGTADGEAENLNLLYRNVENYATGHGCAVKWNTEDGRVRSVSSEFLPRVDLTAMEPRIIDEKLRLDLEYWAECGREEGLANLTILIDRYHEWFTKLQERARGLRAYTRALKSTFVNIKNCLERLQNGIVQLKRDDTAWRAFQLMNEAMLRQRINSQKIAGRDLTRAEVHWYPFQLAYVLQIIPDIIDKDSEWQQTVDLLWYPTGGGKTEAYLALSAFTLFFRRLSLKEQGGGVTILMRYTLRLLTAQQFERATALICACEYLRQQHKIPGGEISIGLWVGSGVTPNSIENTKKALVDLRADRTVREGNPVQINTCPFCATPLNLGCYQVDNDSLVISCPNEACHFYTGLPIYVIDEDIYRKRPSLVISTVDKFARIVWEERTVAIFGSDGKTRPPELIIQDELHLISGPLGSLKGLYESAVEELCTYKGMRPKIISSTATARNSVKQIKALYNRDSFQFPPTGLEMDDLFFAVRADAETKPSRRYLGLCDTGNSMLDLLVRVYGCLLFGLEHLKSLDFSEEVIDQYYTIVGYFNTLRELGSSATVISDRVQAYANSLRLHKFKALAEQSGMEQIRIGGHRELTSRRSAQEVKETLADLEYAYPDERALSYVLASNMLSVGIDISRLGVMTVYRQPKMNAEYIQATSRVGRSKPGLVITMYNSISSRDKSHFEHFSYYHNTFYKHVEPTSVTPFSFRALEKALHAVYIALIRHRIPEMRGNNGASRYNSRHPEVRKIREYLLGRVEDVAPDSLPYARHWLGEFEKLWTRLCQSGAEIFYSQRHLSAGAATSLLIESEKDNTTDIPSTLNSLRNVDGVSNVYLLKREAN